MGRSLESRKTDDQLRILLISGSIREPSYTRALTEQIDAALLAMGSTTTHWILSERPLPIAEPRFHEDPGAHTNGDVRALTCYADAADAFVLCTPIYHNSFSGALKNALDHLSISQFRYKAVALGSHGGNRSTQAVDQLRIVVRGLFGVAIPTQVCTASKDYSEIDSATYGLSSGTILERIMRLAIELTLFARCLRPARTLATSVPAEIGVAAARGGRRSRSGAGEPSPAQRTPTT